MVTSRSARILVASNRGPVSFREEDDGTLSSRRGGGGLVSGLSAIGPDTNAVWVCAALSDADRRAAREAPEGRLDAAGHDTNGQAVRMLDIEPGTFHRAYNGVANSTLWFVHHLLYDTPLNPVFDDGFQREWDSFEAYNAAFADSLAAEAAEGAAVLVQDYHLALTPALLRERRPSLRIGHFSHTPWAPPEYYRLLPDDIARRVLTGVLGADRAAFLTRRWAGAFADCCEQVLGARVERPADGDITVTHEGRTTRVGVHGLGADAEFLRERAHRPDVDERLAALRETVGDRRVIVRVDRTELSKNIVRSRWR
jgi:trehalose 6-phosphate synthase